MNFTVLVTNKSAATLNQFWTSIRVWLNHPHLVNKRVLSFKTIFQAELKGNIESVFLNIFNTNNVSQFIDNIFNENFSNLNIGELSILSGLVDLFSDDKNGKYLIINKLFPRDNDNFATTVDFLIIDKSSQSIICLQKTLEHQKRSLGLDWPYKIIYYDEQVEIMIGNTETLSNNPCIQWLKDKLYPSLMKWMLSDNDEKNSFVKGSLNLIGVDKYCVLYNNLKKKYGLELVEKWPECTDPKKFVYEDIAIATYLLVLWEEEREEKGIVNKQSFLDLGCGNGLLVYILTNEGHQGLGIDLRRRKIWDLFSATPLEVGTIFFYLSFFFSFINN